MEKPSNVFTANSTQKGRIGITISASVDQGNGGIAQS